MYSTTVLKSNSDYFLPLSRRDNKCVFFNKFIGYDNELMIFLKKYQLKTVSRGIYYKEAIKNPTENEVNRCRNNIDENFVLDIRFLSNNLGKMLARLDQDQIRTLSEAFYDVLKEIKESGSNDSILKNTYIKFMCWIYRFQSFLSYIGNDDNPKILFEGDISKYDYYMLRLLSLSGCDVVYINFISGNTFNKYDKGRTYEIKGRIKGNPTEHFLSINLQAIEETDLIHDKLITNSWIGEEDFFELVLKKNNLRGVLIDPNKDYNILVQYLGVDDEGIYNNRLLFFKNNLEKSGKKYLIIDEKIENPSISEVVTVDKTKCLNKKKLIHEFIKVINSNISGDIKPFIIKAFNEVLEEYNESSINQLYNFAMKLCCWINRYKEILVYDNNNLSSIIYFGDISQSEGYFLKMISKMPIDVIYISPNKIKSNELEGKIIELPKRISIEKYPIREMKVKVATTAYEAERQIQEVLYSDIGMYRNRQFRKSSPITLKTTYEEIFILWNQEAKYRPSFNSTDEKVYVPNIFAKVCGVKDGHTNNYYKAIKSLITDKTIYVNKLPILGNKNRISDISMRSILKNGQLNIDEVKNINEYKYDYLNSDTQDYIIEKIQELIELKWIKYTESDLVQIVLGVLLDIDKETLNLIQQFDFTKDIPKVVIIDTNETMANLNDCIYLLFLNLIGFDIIIFTPTGYRNIEKYIKEDSFENYVIGEFMFNLKAPKYKAIQIEKNRVGFFDLFFLI